MRSIAFGVIAALTSAVAGSEAAAVGNSGLSFRAAASATNGVSVSISIDTPPGIVAGDVLLAVVDVVGAPTVAPPSGWTLIRSDVAGSGDDALGQSSYHHVVGSLEPATHTFALGAPRGASGAILAYSGVDATTPVEASSGATSTTTAISAPAVTTTGVDRMIVGLFGQTGLRSIAQPTGMIERHELGLSNPPGQKVTSESADAFQTAAGDSGARMAMSNLSGRGVGQLIALVPSSGTPPPPGGRPPVIDSVVIDQAAPTTNQMLTATVDAHDPDGDPLILTYQWRRNGVDIAAAGSSSLDLSVDGHGDEGDQLTLLVVASDGAGTSEPVISAPITVVNSAPSATVTIAPSAPTPGQVLTATVTATDSDIQDTVSLTYLWKRADIVVQQTGPTTSPTDGYDLAVSGNGDPGDTITVEVVPNDGEVDGLPASASATISSMPVISEYPIPGVGSKPGAVALGPDGRVLIGDGGRNRIHAIDADGRIQSWRIPTPNAGVGGITTGLDGAVWFVESDARKLARLDLVSGTFSEYPWSTAGQGLAGIVRGPDGNLYVIQSASNRIAKVSIDPVTQAPTVLAEYQPPTANAWPHGPSVSPDGQICFAEFHRDKLACMTTAGVFKEKVLPTGSQPAMTTFGADGAMYATLSGTTQIAKWSRSTTGKLTLYPVPTASSRPYGVTIGANGNIYATEWYGNRIAQMPLGGGAVTETLVPTDGAIPNKIALGSDGRLYFSEQAAGAIGVYRP